MIALCEREGGCTLKDITEKLGVSKVVAASFIADARAEGIKVKFAIEAADIRRLSFLRFRANRRPAQQRAPTINRLNAPALPLDR